MQWKKILRKFDSITSTYHKRTILFCRYFGHVISYQIGSVFKICVWIPVFRRKKLFVNTLHGLQVTTIFVDTGEFRLHIGWHTPPKIIQGGNKCFSTLSGPCLIFNNDDILKTYSGKCSFMSPTNPSLTSFMSPNYPLTVQYNLVSGI